MRGPQIFAALSGDLRASIERDVRRFRQASNEATKEHTDKLKGRSRARVRQAFPGGGARRGARRVANAIRGVVRDAGEGFQRGTVFSKFGKREGGEFIDYLLPFVRGAEIRPVNSKWIYIPADGGKRRSRRVRRSSSLEKGLRFVPSGQPGKIYLVKETRSRSTLVAVLVRRLRITKKLDFEGEKRAAGDGLLRDLARGVEKL